MAGLNAADILQVTMRGTHCGQTILNVFHYQVLEATTETSYAIAAQNFADGFDAGTSSPGLKLLDCMGANYTWVSTRVQRIYPTRDLYVDSLVDLPGTLAEDAYTANVAAVITKRGPLAGKKYIGSTHIGAVPANYYGDGLLTPVYKAKMLTAANRYRLPYTPTVGDGVSRMIIYNKSNPALSLGIQAVTVQPEVRIMRRRTVGLGI